MPKSLGQIHTVNYTIGETGGVGLAAGQQYLIDLPGQLTQQLQTMVRAGGYFKVVGIDMSMRNIAGAIPVDGVTCAGDLDYYAPTQGRCNALRMAYKAVRAAMKVQGINVKGNRSYDFRVAFTNPAAVTCINGADFFNAATFDGTNMLTLDSSGALQDEVFQVYNSNLSPTLTGAPAFTTGFGLPGQAGIVATDFVLQEGEYYEASLTHAASATAERIPFSLAYGLDAGVLAVADEMQWRPDPALYLAVLTGQFLLKILSMGGPQPNYRIDLAIHVAGWKSVLGSGKKRHSKKGRR